MKKIRDLFKLGLWETAILSNCDSSVNITIFVFEDVKYIKITSNDDFFYVEAG